MKKTILLFCLIAMMLSLCSCLRPLPTYNDRKTHHTGESTQDTEKPEVSTEETSETEAPTEPEPAFVAPALSDCIGLYSEASVNYSDGYNDYQATYQLPEILLDSWDAKRANEWIRTTFQPSIDDSIQAEMDKVSLFCFGISYEAWIYDRYLSLVITETNDWDCGRYLVLTFDLTDGSWLSNKEFAAYLGMDDAALFEAIRSSLLYHFDDTYSDLPAEFKDDFFYMQRDKQTSDDAVYDTELFIGRDGSVQMACALFSMAGADSYAHLLPLILTVN